MAVKYYCDGCGKDISRGPRVKVSMESHEDGYETNHGPWDLCTDCRDRMLPIRWPRPAKNALDDL